MQLFILALANPTTATAQEKGSGLATGRRTYEPIR